MSYRFSFPTFDDIVEPISPTSPPSDHPLPTGKRSSSIVEFLEHTFAAYTLETETASAARERADKTTNSLISQLRSKFLQLSQELESNDQTLRNMQRDLASKDHDLCNTKLALSGAKRDLSVAKQDLSATKSGLSAAKKELEMIKGKLNVTKKELGMTKKRLVIAREEVADIKDEILDYKADCNLAMEKIPPLELALSAATREATVTSEQLEATNRELEDTKTALAHTQDALYNAVNERDHVLLKIRHLEGDAGELSESDHASDTSDMSSQFFNFYLTPPELASFRRKRDEDDADTPTRPQKKIHVLVKEAPAEQMDTDSILMSWGDADFDQGVEEAARLGEEEEEEEEEDEDEDEEQTGEEDIAEVDVDDVKDGDYETSEDEENGEDEDGEEDAGDGTSEDEAGEDQDQDHGKADQKVSRIIRIRVPLDQRSK